MIVQMTIKEFEKVLPKICGKDTSSDSGGWTKENLFWGQGAAVSLLAQSLFQGKIFGVSLKNTKFAKMKFHFWNTFPDGIKKDFTRSQFGREYPRKLQAESIEATLLLAGKNTFRRFKLLQERFEAECKKK
jgi:hypothetical protein